MKKINFNQLFMSWNEKQKPRRIGRYAAMLIMLLTLGVGQMWGKTFYLHPSSDWKKDGAKFAICYGYDGSSDQSFVAMTAIAGTEWYSAEVPSSASSKNVYFMRVSSSWKESDKWTNKWNGFGWYSYANGDRYVNESAGDSGDKLDAGFESSENGIKYYKNSDASNTEWKFNGQSAQTKDLSTITNLYLKEWFTYEYETKDLWDASTIMMYNVHRTAASAGSYTSAGAKNWDIKGDWSGTPSYCHPKTGKNNADINLLSGLGSGLYTMSFYYYDPKLYITSPTHTLTWTIAVPSMATHTHSSDGTGSGTSGSPYLKGVGNTLRITVAGTQSSSDANSVLYVSFDGGDTYSTTNYIDIAISNTTKSSVAIKAKYYNSADDLSGTVYDFGDVYYQGTVTPSLGWAASDPYTPTTLVSGEDITLTVVRSNSSANITYQYKIGSGSWTDITTTSSQSYTYTIPEAHGATQTYYFRATMTDGSTYTTASSSAVTVYGKKTLTVKNRENWATFKLYAGDGNTGAWPGTASTGSNGFSISRIGTSQWYTVVITSANSTFLLNNGGSGPGNQTGDLSYSSYSDGGYYECYNHSGNTVDGRADGQLYNSSEPTKPTSITTSAPSSLTNTVATMNGNIGGNGNDAITDYGFYWGTTSTPATKVSKGTSDYSGSISHQLTSLTAGTTYYYQAYATNGFGTTKSSPVQSFVEPYKVTITKPTGCSAITPDAGTQYVHIGDEISSTAATGYTFSSWSVTNVTLSSPTTTTGVTTSTISAISADNGTIQPVYTENMTTVNLVASPTGKGTFTSGGTVTSVSAGVDTHPTVTAVPETGYHLTGTIWSESSAYISISATNTASTTITATGTTGNSADLTATFTPNTYTVRFHRNGGAGDVVNQDFTYDAAQNLTANTYTRTGYTFAGWALTTDGAVTYADGAEVSNLTSTNDGTFHLYAKWTANNYAVTLSTTGETGYGSGAPDNQTATYGAAMPTITPPVGAPGYKFQGYWTGAGGTGTKYYNADGTSATNWNIAEATTLHAYFLEAEITALEHETSVAKAEEAELVVNPTINIVPEGYLSICWTLHYADNDNPVDRSHWDVASYDPEEDKPNQVKFTFTNLAIGSYYVKATLRKSASAFENVCTDGTEIMDIHGNFHVVGSNTVKVRYMTTTGDFVLKAPTEVEVEAMSTAEVTAPEIPGYTFNRWYLGDGITKESGAYTDATITISATYDGVITARYSKKKMVYFNNTVGWDTVYVYFYNGAEGNKYWANDYGTGAYKDQTFNGNKPFYQMYYGGMKRVAPGSNIWYFDYLAAGFSEGDISANIAFAAKKQAVTSSSGNQDAYFYNTEAIFRDDFNPSKLPMYVPLTSPTTMRNSSTTKYYDQGYWMNYPESTGYELRFYNKRANDGTAPYELVSKRHKFEFTGDKTLPLSVSLDLEAGQDYFFKIYRVDDTYYGNNNMMSNGHSGDEGQPAWEFKTGTENAWMRASGAGYYTFTLRYGIDASSNYNYLVGVRYPESTGDFRVLYSDAVRVTNHGSEGASWLASYVIPKTTESDTVSFFVRKASTPKIKAQKCTATYDEGTGTTTVTWADENGGADLLPDTISADGVYNFIFTKEDGELVLTAVEPYKGNFYIRVDGAGSTNWDNFRASDHLMPYSDYSFKQEDEPYSHYFTQWYEPVPKKGDPVTKNIKFVVANDYSASISDTIIQDGIADAYVDGVGNISRNANIRFMYNYKTNAASRRYVDGAQENGSEFLVLVPSNSTSIYDAETGGSAYSQVTFSDKGNWIYEANVWVVPGTQYKLESHFGEAPVITQYLKGAASGDGQYETLIAGSGTSRLQIRLVYDFKTNRLISAYIPSSTISDELAINADVMFIREAQNDVQQLTFTTNEAKLTDIKSVYSVLRFNKWTLNNRYTTGGHGLLPEPKSIYERSLYFISFPFDVKLSDVIGLGTYWNEWYIEYYDGAARAKNGFWIDSEPYWKYVTPAMKDTFTLKAGTGYLFGLDLDYLVCEGEGEGQQADVWKNIQTADFIFPGNISAISNSEVTYTLPAHTCTINRGTASGNRTIADSHWNVLGVPTYLNTSSMTLGGEGATNANFVADGKLKFLYTWNPQDNALSPTSASGFTYHAMYAYMVQYYGTITFTTSVSPTAAPRRNPEYRGEYEFRLEIQNNDEALDQTYVRLSDDEEVTPNFEFGYDLTKAQNGRAANIYTIVEGYLEAAGNSLPLTNQTTIVPVGVKVNTAGDFTFAMPDGTDGVGVTLIDTETGIRTSLSALNYTINLTAGTYNNRFILEISPISQNPTDIEAVSDQNSAVRKVMIDGILYIVKGNRIYDATGALVK